MNLDFYLLHCGYCENSLPWCRLFRNKNENTYILSHHLSFVVPESGYDTVISLLENPANEPPVFFLRDLVEKGT